MKQSVRELNTGHWRTLDNSPPGVDVGHGIILSNRSGWHRVFTERCFATPLALQIRCRVDTFRRRAPYDGVTLLIGAWVDPNDFNAALPVVQWERGFTSWQHEDRRRDPPYRELGARHHEPALTGAYGWRLAQVVVDPDRLLGGHAYEATIIGGPLDDRPLRVFGDPRPGCELARHVRIGVRADGVRAQWAVSAVQELR